MRVFFLIMLSYFSVLPAQYVAFFGNLHSHTGNSDGEGTPAEAFAYARDVADIDFLAVTDHLEQIYYLSYRWTQTKTAADAVTVDGVFVGIAGYEWGSTLYNHCNVFDTPNMVTPLTYLNWHNFADDVYDERPAFAQFNHPGEDVTINWDNFAFLSAHIDSIFPLIEVKTFMQDSFYQMALDSGWHVSPVANQDNHSADWGTANDRRAGIWATELTRAKLFEAIRARRTFSTQDKNASVWISVDGCDMGSRIFRTPTMALRIMLDDENGEIWNEVQLISEGDELSFFRHNAPAHFDTTISISPTSAKWFFVRALQTDGDYIWSAPIFIEGDLLNVIDKQVITHFEQKVFPNPFNSVCNIFVPAESQIQIYNLDGKQIFQAYAHTSNGAKPTNIIWNPTETLPSGTYILHIATKNYTSSSTILYIK